MEKWPNFFIVGAPRSGTTSLYAYLQKNPDIYLPQVKEPHYFSPDTIPDKAPFFPVRDKEKYLSLFEPATDEPVVGEASTMYLHDAGAYRSIHEKSPDARILISLRDPVERAWSHYLLIKRAGYTQCSFGSQIKKELQHLLDPDHPRIRLEIGFYNQHVKKYIDLFGPDHVKIIIFEEWVKSEQMAVQGIVEFLGLKSTAQAVEFTRHHGYKRAVGRFEKKLRRIPVINSLFDSVLKGLPQNVRKRLLKTSKPEMDDKSRETLTGLYRDDVKALEKLLGRKLPWLNFQDAADEALSRDN